MSEEKGFELTSKFCLEDLENEIDLRYLLKMLSEKEQEFIKRLFQGEKLNDVYQSLKMSKETLKIRLAEAEEAYHKLLIGAKEVTVNVGNFGSVTYNQTSRAALESYISSLKSQIAAAEGKLTSRRRMIKVVF